MAAQVSEPFTLIAELARSVRALRRAVSQLRRTAWAALSDAGTITTWSRELPRLELQLSHGTKADVVLDGLTFCQPWPLRYRAVGVIRLPECFQQYLRGRARQAVRTNRRHAQTLGLTAFRASSRGQTHTLLAAMLRKHSFYPTVDDACTRYVADGRLQIWFVTGPDGTPVGMAAVGVDRAVAQLATLQVALDVPDRSAARYLLSTEIVCGLIAQATEYLVADSMLLSPPGVVYLQRRLGFEPMHIGVPRHHRWRRAVRRFAGRNPAQESPVEPWSTPNQELDGYLADDLTPMLRSTS